MFTFIDYSGKMPEYKTESGKTPAVRSGKFVQIRHDDDEYIVFAPKALCKYHAHIVEEFANDPGFDLTIMRNNQGSFFDDIDWRIIGGGKMLIDTGNRILQLGGDSKAYGAFDRSVIVTKLSSVPQFKDYKIELLK